VLFGPGAKASWGRGGLPLLRPTGFFVTICSLPFIKYGSDAKYLLRPFYSSTMMPSTDLVKGNNPQSFSFILVQFWLKVTFHAMCKMPVWCMQQSCVLRLCFSGTF
jgi:hypothetical protein